MFTLCMSREPHRDSDNRDIQKKQVKAGYLLRYKRGLFCKSWSWEWVVLYEDSTMALFADKKLCCSRGCVKLIEAPEMLAVGEWTKNIPRRPRIPTSYETDQLLAISAGRSDNIYWVLAQSPTELNDWVTAISNTPSSHFPLEKRLSLIPQKSQQVSSIRGCKVNADMHKAGVKKGGGGMDDADHTVLSGVAIDWGHGWGWGQSVNTAACAQEAASATANSALYCHANVDYSLGGGCEEVDWSAFADFSF
ncbi:PREDICTED: uncharacterized protein LOC108557311 isoform X2 [Nicrophorus vespilloides]|uniref:Uncharacterized protein LOC108557311 isoform X2 n=1 Tax=Nicrophorus vespilloides TaxID=110193 RepID=A0ABM1M3X6_NICVS|nr:PREDICTED: uncharacterized protein LOC108557311 isoform X2 [Nicrophorus vespilloides]